MTEDMNKRDKVCGEISSFDYIEQQETQIKELESKISSLEEKRTFSKNRVKKINLGFEECSKAHSSVIEKADRLEAENKELLREKAAAIGITQGKQAVIERLEAENKELKEARDLYRNRTEEASEKIPELEAKLKQAEEGNTCPRCKQTKALLKSIRGESK